MRTILLPLILLAAACTPDAAPEELSIDEPDTSTTTPDDTSADTDTEPACGNGVVEEGEDCDDGGESSTCDEDCTEVACGDKTLNRTAGEECDPPDDDETCLSDCTARVGNCHLPTPWEEIAASLADEADLPTLPDKNQDSEWEAPLPELLFHEIAPTSRSTDEDVTDETCDLPTFWDADRVSTGSFVPAEEEDDEDYCRVRASPGSGDDPILYFVTRDPVGSIHVPVTGEPSWVQLRFPIPEGHRAVELDYEVNQARLFGSHPTECDEDDQDEHGTCTLAALDEDESWDEEVPPGLFLLWGRASDCEGWLITGPHEPAADATWSATESYTVAVPESLQEVDELVVALMVYHQYPGGCDGDYCIEGEKSYYSLGFSHAELQTEAWFDPPETPSTDHPRLLGDDSTWWELGEAFESLDCVTHEDWPENSSWGEVPNVRNIWDLYTRGGYACLAEAPTTLKDHAEAWEYLDGSAAEDFDAERAMRILYLLRHERACQDLDPSACWFDESEVDTLAAAVINAEMGRIKDAPWSTMGFDMDLYTREPLQAYSLLADVLWDDLSAEDHATILAVTGEQIDAYITHFDEPHWAIYNGNNWTPVLAEGVLYWAVVYYHEDERAPLVAWRALQTLWLHRDYYLEDGVYREGLMMYSQVSFDPLVSISRVAATSFGLTLPSIPWERMSGFADWSLGFMAPDGGTIDFSDSWSKRGWSTFMPLLAQMADPDVEDFTGTPDPCQAHIFFSNKYYYHGLTVPWKVHPSLAQDWFSVVRDCTAEAPGLPVGVEVGTWEEGGWGSIRIGLPDATTLADTEPGTDPSRYRQADQVMLAISAIPNEFEHTELDFGTVVWTAFGNRLLWDFGYGTLESARYNTVPDHSPDQNPTGHNTLVIPEAYEDDDTSTNTSQIDGESGSIEQIEIDGYTTILLDGSAVYGRDDEDDGWLEHFQRRLIPLESGHIILVDDFMVREDREEAGVAEYWYTMPWTDTIDIDKCKYQDSDVQVVLSEDQVDLLPACTSLGDLAAESAGRMLGLSVEPGGFVRGETISIVNRLDDVDSRDQFRWDPSGAVSRDLRIFALLAAPGEDALPQASLTWSEDCTEDHCAVLQVDGTAVLQLDFVDEKDRYTLVSISAK